MNPILDYPQGYYTVGRQCYVNKFAAIVAARQLQQPLNYHFHDSVWRDFDRSQVREYNLQTLYRARAQQLREQYDYLILYFSGGAVSYNILRSFIDNGIHLDEVCVKWAQDTRREGIYKPNASDTDTTNYLSEWDYAIVPVLNEISSSHPQIKIQIVDWFRDTTEQKLRDSFARVNHWHDIEIGLCNTWSPSEAVLVDQGKTVGSIYGVDKPNVMYREGVWYTYFFDCTQAMGTPNPINPWGTEYFYYTPRMPELVFARAHAAVQAYISDPVLKKLIVQGWQDNTLEHYTVRERVLRSWLYDNWTQRFQVTKPTVPLRTDKHPWITAHSELENYVSTFTEILTEHMTILGQDPRAVWSPGWGAQVYRLRTTELFKIYQ